MTLFAWIDNLGGWHVTHLSPDKKDLMPGTNALRMVLPLCAPMFLDAGIEVHVATR